jgi:hypothetical protein
MTSVMRKFSLLFLCIFCLATWSCQAQYERNVRPAIYRYGNPKGFALIELYTSEGCSSCPKAEIVTDKLQEFYRDRLYVLEFHVDYWNRLGWVDSFSDAAYSARQNRYTQAFKMGSAYTPQTIVNGKKEANGSERLVLKQLIETEMEQQPDSAITLTARRDGANTVTVNYTAGLRKDDVLNIALTQRYVTKNVTAGENAGRQLEHESVVRYFETVQDRSGKITINLPEGISAKECRVMAFIQQRSNLHVQAATDTSIGE